MDVLLVLFGLQVIRDGMYHGSLVPFPNVLLLRCTYLFSFVLVFSFVGRYISGLVMGRRWRAGPSIFDMMGRGPARPIYFSFGGPRPGPAHQLFI